MRAKKHRNAREIPSKLKLIQGSLKAVSKRRATFEEPLRVVASETLGDDFLVPADAEFVIEGYIPAKKGAPEGLSANTPAIRVLNAGTPISW